MNLLSLNDDVLLHIFTHLQGGDALRVCLTCKRIYCLAIGRVASVAQCWSPPQLRQLCDYFSSPDSYTAVLRAKYLENLTIHASTFEKDLYASDSQGVDIDDLELDGQSLVGTDFSQAHLVGELLLHAQNIQELSLDRFHALIEAHASIPGSFSSMHRLAHVRLSMVGDGTLDSLRYLANPKRLTLSYHTEYDDPLDEPKTLPPLVQVLARFDNLHTVKLWNFTPPHTESAALPYLPSVRYLRLSQSSVPALSMVELCPNLSTLVFSVDSDFGDVVASSGPRWRPLRRLMLATPEEAVCVVDRVKTVDLLQIAGALELVGFSAPEDGDAVSQFLELLRTASPISLYVSVRVGMGGFSSSFWKDIAAYAPRLRSMELKLYHFLSQSGEDGDWLTRLFVEALRGIHIHVLKILVPVTPQPIRMIYSWELDSEIDNLGALSEAKTREKERVYALAALPRPLVDAIPSLRYLSVADMAPNPALWDDSLVESHNAASNCTRKGVVYEWDELRHVDCIREQRWWKIVDDRDRRSLVEISEDEGRDAQHLIEEGGSAMTAHIEGEYISRCHLPRVD
ncbi:hypothetical protein BD310DRAFT_972660 [Dichomitus squalens]|uniref:F-box domain-containing protein n=1 Tax=Dichomitus squalens TaxID=114155 RepID=A0A4Q9QC11_9APHY|nr:hypothetical protein BD310DRAFT_972660 [Dichomitus squalens]